MTATAGCKGTLWSLGAATELQVQTDHKQKRVSGLRDEINEWQLSGLGGKDKVHYLTSTQVGQLGRRLTDVPWGHNTRGRDLGL